MQKERMLHNSYKVEMEVWKKSRKCKGVYVSPLVMDL
ncbi:hypothetical protein R3I93_006653 [Phoxinus phoxinus]|uniref:Uncharacterized protein n=1 Tax=Phoxinus phoxinus TaxID=58324 RepID=A0AAN9H905_9TELE